MSGIPLPAGIATWSYLIWIITHQHPLKPIISAGNLLLSLSCPLGNRPPLFVHPTKTMQKSFIRLLDSGIASSTHVILSSLPAAWQDFTIRLFVSHSLAYFFPAKRL